jgi:6-pyruvoyltetrahydropterin/6-carboxytetrahydropterin synthase
MLYLSQSFYFESAHTLKRAVDAEASARVHGHTYRCEVTVRGGRNAQGFVIDLAHLRARVEPVRLRLDHRLLDDVAGLGAPTLENLCLYVATALPECCRVAVWRDASGDRCEWRDE